jgi:REP element-mobilizing transposase RayT
MRAFAAHDKGSTPMSHSYTSSLYHVVFSTKERRKQIDADLQSRLWPYLGGIARDNNMKAFAVGGVEDHVHLLLSLPSTIAIAKAVQLIKGGSSKWIHDEFPTRRDFAWQEGYGAFSIGVSQKDDTIRYIDNQAVHHRAKTYEEEFLAFLQRHGIDYDPRYIWG